MRLNSKKLHSWWLAGLDSVYGDFTLGGAELKEIKSLPVFGVNLDPKLTFDTYLRG